VRRANGIEDVVDAKESGIPNMEGKKLEKMRKRSRKEQRESG
jgi:hypothetical protein